MGREEQKNKCTRCGAEFDTWEELAQHFLDEHPSCNVKLF